MLTLSQRPVPGSLNTKSNCSWPITSGAAETTPPCSCWLKKLARVVSENGVAKHQNHNPTTVAKGGRNCLATVSKHRRRNCRQPLATPLQLCRNCSQLPGVHTPATTATSVHGHWCSCVW